jgi:hypothetical protein
MVFAKRKELKHTDRERTRKSFFIYSPLGFDSDKCLYQASEKILLDALSDNDTWLFDIIQGGFMKYFKF